MQAAMIANWHSRNAQMEIGAMLSKLVSIHPSLSYPKRTSKVLQALIGDRHCQDRPNHVTNSRSTALLATQPGTTR